MMARCGIWLGNIARLAASYWRLMPMSLAGITLVWQPNTESDLAGYKVYFGERSRQYTQIIDVGTNTFYALDHLPRNKTYYFVVTAYDVNGNESSRSQEVILEADPNNGGDTRGAESTLATVYNFPNPFIPGREATTLRYYLAQSAAVTIRVYDVSGALIKTLADNAPRPAGENATDFWDGTDARGARVSPGLYYVEIQAQGRKSVIRVAVMP